MNDQVVRAKQEAARWRKIIDELPDRSEPPDACALITASVDYNEAAANPDEYQFVGLLWQRTHRDGPRFDGPNHVSKGEAVYIRVSDATAVAASFEVT